MDELQRMSDLVSRLDVGLFARSRAGLYLLGLYPSAADAPQTLARTKTFHTSPAISVDELMACLRQQESPHLAGRFLVKVEKSPRNPFRGRISVGRAGNNDVVIVHPSLSKLHAHFLVDEVSAGLGQGALQIVDAGSSNGTFVGGRRLEPDRPEPVAPGARIRLGDLHCHLWDAEGLYRALHAGG